VEVDMGDVMRMFMERISEGMKVPMDRLVRQDLFYFIDITGFGDLLVSRGYSATFGLVVSVGVVLVSFALLFVTVNLIHPILGVILLGMVGALVGFVWHAACSVPFALFALFFFLRALSGRTDIVSSRVAIASFKCHFAICAVCMCTMCFLDVIVIDSTWQTPVFMSLLVVTILVMMSAAAAMTGTHSAANSFFGSGAAIMIVLFAIIINKYVGSGVILASYSIMRENWRFQAAFNRAMQNPSLATINPTQRAQGLMETFQEKSDAQYAQAKPLFDNAHAESFVFANQDGKSSLDILAYVKDIGFCPWATQTTLDTAWDVFGKTTRSMVLFLRSGLPAYLFSGRCDMSTAGVDRTVGFTAIMSGYLGDFVFWISTVWDVIPALLGWCPINIILSLLVSFGTMAVVTFVCMWVYKAERNIISQYDPKEKLPVCPTDYLDVFVVREDGMARICVGVMAGVSYAAWTADAEYYGVGATGVLFSVALAFACVGTYLAERFHYCSMKIAPYVAITAYGMLFHSPAFVVLGLGTFISNSLTKDIYVPRTWTCGRFSDSSMEMLLIKTPPDETLSKRKKADNRSLGGER
jgi:hypothetical protein